MKPDELIPLERRALETMSETSEGTTTTSVSGHHGFETREELLEFATMLGVTNVDDLHRERFRVDRRKLEQMLLGNDDNLEPADTFFHKIMDKTNTLITWPSRLKIGAKSKKDPHIKVVGRMEDVRLAKERIMQVLDTRSMRVTMKLDVSYTDHSHIIGKGGLTIKRVMEETGCHIHFPDSNRSNHQEKSNQVSIAGELEGVEKARARVRNLTPLIFSFELPIMGSIQTIPDSTSPYIIKIQEKYNVQVMFRTRPKLHATLVVVKGCEWEVAQVKEATSFLIHQMCKNLANQISVQMTMEISPQHHSIVLGKQNSNLKLIMQRTSTQIIFPDAGDPNIPSLKKSCVLIIGGINDVYLARQQLIGSLPLVLMFDLPENSVPSFDTDGISQLMQNLDVFINIRHKPKQSSLSVIIKSVERNASKMYEARRQLLSLKEPKVQASIPSSYNIPHANNAFLGNSHSMNGNLMGFSDSLANVQLTINTQTPSPYSLSPLSLSPNPMNFSSNWAIPSLFSPIINPTSYPFNHPNVQLLAATRQAMQANLLNSQQQHQQNNHKLNNPFHNHLVDYLSYSSASSTLSSPTDSPRNVSPIGTVEHATSMDISSVLSDLSLSDRQSDSNSVMTELPKQQPKQHSQNHLSTFDYEQKKILAVKAMQNKLKSSEYRVPTTTWSGYGFSQTMPATITSLDSTANQTCNLLNEHSSNIWDDPKTPLAYTPPLNFNLDTEKDDPLPLGMTSTYVDHTPNSRLEKILSGSHTDLASMLASVGLEKYIRLLTSHEVDMTTFRSLTEKDLSEIGITAWGARRKILLLIAEINKRTMPFSGSAAPGAERKSSLTNSSKSNLPSANIENKW
ncbi:protein bicaudal C isoform X2 [Chelonus insularis]|uniref:protein bicaudal C isoform X2 n=1 Tax=Chelonus insularis TaxID=460826 RepID=UPI00158F5111|nr:protein bicaudal C isoform X2 [Chelonus insularis]